MRAGTGSVTLASASAGDDIALQAPKGMVTVASVLSTHGGADFNGVADQLFSLGDTLLNPTDGLFKLTGKSGIWIAANEFNGFTGQVTTNALGIEGTGTLVLGGSGAGAAGQVTLSQPSLKNINAGAVTLFAPSAANSAVSILPGGSNNRLDLNSSITSLSIYTPGQVTITGALTPVPSGSSPQTTTQLTIGAPTTTPSPTGWTPSSIEVINDATNHGSIGLSTDFDGNATAPIIPSQSRSGGALVDAFFGNVSLSAQQNILFGTQAFIDGLAGKSGVAVDTYVNALQTVPPDQTLLAAGTLTLNASNLIVQQNTSQVGTGFTGALITGVGAGAKPEVSIGNTGGSGPPLPNAVELFMDLHDNQSGVVLGSTSVSISPSFTFTNGSSNHSVYRVNSCVIGEQGNCTALGTVVVNVQPDQLTQILVLEQVTQPDVEDPTITGATNEEIWRKPD